MVGQWHCGGCVSISNSRNSEDEEQDCYDQANGQLHAECNAC